ncbi:MAG: type II 3-dehydroquinate dehydratase [Chloroflexi bacterium]|nr:MAG: type II 3-dehydroquinate dehydratase [Chloroflexota bacterium]
MKILVLNGPNLASLGRRQVEIYGKATLADIETAIRQRAQQLRCEVECVQSNHEGELIDQLERLGPGCDGVIVNPGALTHTSLALYDALLGCGKPVVEVHLSNLYKREEFRHRSVTAPAAVGVIMGLGPAGYLLALDYLAGQKS